MKRIAYTISSGYCGAGWDEKSPKFDKEIMEIFAALGFDVAPPEKLGSWATAPKARKDDREVYLHPIEISGVFTDEEAAAFLKAAEAAETFTFKGVRSEQEVDRHEKDGKVYWYKEA